MCWREHLYGIVRSFLNVLYSPMFISHVEKYGGLDLMTVSWPLLCHFGLADHRLRLMMDGWPPSQPLTVPN